MPALIPAVISTIGGALGTTASLWALGASVVLSVYQRDTAKRKARAQFNASQVDRLVNTGGTTQPRMLLMGRVRVGGFVAFRGSVGVHKEKFVMILALAAHEIDAVEQVYLNDTAVTLDGNGYVLTAPYALSRTETGRATYAPGAVTITLDHDPMAGSIEVTAKRDLSDRGRTETVRLPFSVSGRVVTLTSGPWVPASFLDSQAPTVAYQHTLVTPKARIRAYLGAPGQTADAQVMADFPTLWTSAHVGNWQAFLACEYWYDETAFPSGLPNVTAQVRGARLTDLRTSTTAWSENAALMQRHVLLHPQFGKRTALTAEEEARIIATANACDIGHDYGDGAMPMYRAGVAVPFGTAARDVLDDLASAMGGQWAYAAGQFYPRAGVYTPPVLSLSEADLAVVRRDADGAVSRRAMGINPHAARADKVNTIAPRIWDAAQGSQLVTLTQVSNAALVARDGATLVQELELAAVSYAQQAQHVAGILLRDSRDPLTVTLPFKLTAYRVELFDVVSLTIARYGWVAKPFLVLGRQWSVDGGLMLTLKETAAAIYQPDAAFVPSGYAQNTSLSNPWEIEPPAITSITSGTSELVLQADGTVLTRVRVGWAAVQDLQVLQGGVIELQWATLGGTDLLWSTATANPYETSAFISGAADGEVLLIRARTRSPLAVSDWSPQQAHTVVGQTEPPAAFDFFDIRAQPDGTRQYNFGYTTTEKPVDWQGCEIRYLAGTHAAPVWGDMELLQDEQTFYTSSPVEINAPLEGVWTFSCKSRDRSGNLSAALVRSITLSKRRSGSTYQEMPNDPAWPGTLSSMVKVGVELEAASASTWATLPSTWDAWTQWAVSPAASGSYTTPGLDLETTIAGQVDATVVALGTVTVELSTSADGSTWGAWGPASDVFTARWVRLRVTVAADGSNPLATLQRLEWRVSADIKREYLNDVVVSGLTGAYRIGTGDVRAPIEKTYIVIRVATATVQDSRAGTWSVTRVDKDTTTGPRFRFYLDGVLTDPQFTDFEIEGI